MTDNNGKALREAKAYLAGQVWSDKWADLHPNDPAVLLAALVEEVEAAPVETVMLVGGPDHRDFLTIELGESSASEFRQGQRVRVLAVGEESNG